MMNNTLYPEIQRCTIKEFCMYIVSEYGEYDAENKKFDFDYKKVDLQILANEFIKFFDLQYPLSLENLSTICEESNIQLKLLPNDHKARGYNFSYGGDVYIFYKEYYAPCGQKYTVLHELYEVIDQNFTSYIGYEKEKHVVYEEAEKFAAYVYIPNEHIYDWIITYGLDVFGLKDFSKCSYSTALIRLNDVLCKLVSEKTYKPVSMIGILYERPYWSHTPSGCIPPLQFKCYTKSKGFSFQLSRNEIQDIRFIIKESKEMTVAKLITIFSNSDENFLLKNIVFLFKDQTLIVDVLIRLVNWKKYKYPAKILLQIMPSDQPYLRYLVNRLNNPYIG